MSDQDGRKLSYSELDRLRREGGGQKGPRKPRGEAAQAREEKQRIALSRNTCIRQVGNTKHRYQDQFF